jgi:hypothetical protein
VASTDAWLCAYLGALTSGPLSPAGPPAGWGAVADVAEAEGLAAALGYGLARRPDPTVPAAVALRLQARFKEALARHVVMSRDLAALLRALAAASIPTIPLKGAYLGEVVYPHPAVRPMSDIDVLIPADDRFRVDGILSGLGYRRGNDAHSWAFDVAYDGATFYDGPGGARVDVHWRLLNDPRCGWNRAAGEAVWDRAVPVTLAGERALALSPEDLVLSLAAHLAVHHGLAGLVWYWDLKLVLDRWSSALDWDGLRARAAHWRLRRVLYFVLHRLGDMFPVPPAVETAMARIVPWGPRSRAVEWLVDHRADRLRGLEHVISLLVVDRVGDLLRALGGAICPSPGWLRARYGAGAGRTSLLSAYVAHGARLAMVARGIGQRP